MERDISKKQSIEKKITDVKRLNIELLDIYSSDNVDFKEAEKLISKREKAINNLKNEKNLFHYKTEIEQLFAQDKQLGNIMAKKRDEIRKELLKIKKKKNIHMLYLKKIKKK